MGVTCYLHTQIRGPHRTFDLPNTFLPPPCTQIMTGPLGFSSSRACNTWVVYTKGSDFSLFATGSDMWYLKQLISYPTYCLSIHHCCVIVNHCSYSYVQVYSQTRHDKKSNKNHSRQNVTFRWGDNWHFPLTGQYWKKKPVFAVLLLTTLKKQRKSNNCMN